MLIGVIPRILLGLLLACIAEAASARVLQARIGRVDAPVAQLHDVQVRLAWPAQASQGQLELRAQRVDADDLGYHLRDVRWRCTLQRVQGDWRCHGPIATTAGQAMLALDLGNAVTQARLQRGETRVSLRRDAALPDLTALDLTAVPVAWVQALSRQAWPQGRLTAGRLSGRLAIETPSKAPLRVRGPLQVTGLALSTPDGSVAGEGLNARLQVDYRSGAASTMTLEGALHGGEFLAGNTYLALPASPINVLLRGQRGAHGGWAFPHIVWDDPGVLSASGSALLRGDGGVSQLTMQVRSADLAPVRDRYLSGWLGLAGLGQMTMRGAADGRLEWRDGRLQLAGLQLHEATLSDAGKGFGFEGLQGDLVFSGDAPVRSGLRWRRGQFYGLEMGGASLALHSRDGQLDFAQPVTIPFLGGSLVLEDFRLRPPADGRGIEAQFALDVRGLDLTTLATRFDLPAFKGTVSGRIPKARYADQVLAFDGDLAMELFEGRIRISGLSLERPFGVAPSLVADIDLDDVDLLRMTEVLDVGSITGKLDGRIRQLRLVDWTPVGFDAQFITDPAPGVRQRISQRAVQNISSVGDQSFVTSLQGKLIGLFDDFGYRRIGVSCHLVNEVCSMGGLRSDSNSFTIVEGAGIPRLTVVGFNRQVDWPTLVERIGAIGKGDVKPVID